MGPNQIIKWSHFKLSKSLSNPLLYTDPKGENVTIYYRPPREGGGSLEDFGHILIYVRNDETGESAYFDYYPGDDGLTVVGNVDQNRINDHSSITIETTTEQEQAILEGIKEVSAEAPNYDLTNNKGKALAILGLETSCVTQCENQLNRGQIGVFGQTPTQVWHDAFQKYGKAAQQWVERNPNNHNYLTTGHIPGVEKMEGFSNPRPGYEYGRDPRGQARHWDSNALNANTKTFFKDGKVVKVERY